MDIMYKIVNNIEQRDYIRMYPLWYKEINRHPERYQDLINEIRKLIEYAGENGKIQACFDLMGITYTGTDSVSSAICMDKGITKDIFGAYHIPTPMGIRLKKGEKQEEKVPYPCIVKTSCGGSSVGVCIASNEEEYEKAKEIQV